jgi:hypothetical protein
LKFHVYFPFLGFHRSSFEEISPACRDNSPHARINHSSSIKAVNFSSAPFRFAAYAGMDIGTDNGLPVVPTFQYAKVLPKYFKGTIEKVEFDFKPAKQRPRYPTDVSGTFCCCSSQLSDPVRLITALERRQS